MPTTLGRVSIFTRPWVTFCTSAIQGSITSSRMACPAGSQFEYFDTVVWAAAGADIATAPSSARAPTRRRVREIMGELLDGLRMPNRARGSAY